jgi:type II secretory pathway component GspD/PulD (secretin)
MVSIKVIPEVSSVIAFSDGIPVVKTSTSTTTVMVEDGTTAIIAGLIEEEEVVTQKMVPLLGKIPLLGMLFRSTDSKVEKRELVILLTPHIQTGSEDEEWVPAFSEAP